MADIPALGGLRRATAGVRGRSTLLSTAIVTLTLVLGAVLLLSLYRSRLLSNLDSTLLQQAQDRTQLIDDGTDPSALTTVLLDESMVWIGTLDGRALAVSGAIRPLESPLPATLGGVETVELLAEERKPDESEVETERMELRTASALTVDGATLVLVGAEIEQIDKAVRQLAVLFLAAIPLLILLVGGLTWLSIGSALGPVDRIRLRAKEVSGSNLGERVPVPDGRDEIHHLAITMNDMLDRLEAHQHSLQQFTADASHELKSPVANLRALVETATVDDPAWPQLRTKLAAESDRLRDLVDNLLFLASHDDTTSLVGTTTSLNLDDLLFDEAELLAATGRVAVNIDAITPVTLAGNRQDIDRLVRNLIDNAARHAESTVALGCYETDDTVVLTVADDGDGIAAEDRLRVFERFTRLDDARARDTGGSGLGLTIVGQIVAEHGGTIEIGDGPHGGAAVTVGFPSSAPDHP